MERRSPVEVQRTPSGTAGPVLTPSVAAPTIAARSPAALLQLSRLAGNRAVVATTAGDRIIRRREYGIGELVTAGAEDATPGVAALAAQVNGVVQEFPAGRRGEIRARLRQAAGGGTGAFAQGLALTVDVAAPEGGWPAADHDPAYTDIPVGARAAVWDQIAFELRNAYNSPQFDRAKNVGLYDGSLLSGGDAKADAECITLVLYLADMQRTLAGAPAEGRVELANNFGLRARRSVLALNALADVTPAALFAWFASTPHGGAGAIADTREATASNVMYTVERIEGWNRGMAEKVIYNRLDAPLRLGPAGPTARPAIRTRVAALLTETGYPADPEAVPDGAVRLFDDAVTAVDHVLLETDDGFGTFLTEVGVPEASIPAVRARRAEIRTAFLVGKPPAELLAAAARGHAAPVPPATDPLTGDQVTRFTSRALPTEREMTTALQERYPRARFRDSAAEGL